VSYEIKAGAGGTLALTQFVGSKKGDPQALLVVGAVMVGGTLQNETKVTLSDATPIARLITEYNVFVVPASSPIKSMKDAVDMLKRDPSGMKWGGGSRGSIDHISVALIARASNVDASKLSYLPLKSGAEVMEALNKGQITVGTSGFAEFEEAIQTGKVRAIGFTAPTRQKGVSVPTLIEQGIDVQIGNWRGIYAAPGITPEQRKALVDMVGKAIRTPAWVETVQKNRWGQSVMLGDKFASFVDEETVRLRALMSKLGLLEKR
jgi:putative tricarboxylic transport membrane protein